MTRRLIPITIADRVSAAGAVAFSVLFVVEILGGYYMLAVLSTVAVALSIVNAYVLQTEPSSGSSSSEYTAVITKIASVSDQLSQLGQFLERERARVEDTEATMRRLIDERSRLEPVVQSHRQTVEAILAAHAERTTRSAWKERLYGSLFGIIASVVASFIYEYLRK